MELANSNFVYPDLSYKIIGFLYQVSNDLGGGYQEKYYQRGVAAVFAKNGLKFSEQVYVPLILGGTQIGCYYLDFLVENVIVVEIKKGDYFAHTNIQQLSAYLKSTGLQLGILANFTNKGVRIKRVVNIN